MITEDYVSFEIAKQLKEKGFDEGCRARYGTAGSFSYEKYEIESGGCEMHNAILAPTLQMAMKWLREVHNIALNVCYLLGMWSYSVYRTDASSSGFNSEDFDTYEEAAEAGIRYCLENLI